MRLLMKSKHVRLAQSIAIVDGLAVHLMDKVPPAHAAPANNLGACAHAACSLS